MLEDSCILIQGRSVEEVPEGVEVPEVKGWRNGRMDVKAFRAKIEVLSPTSARTSIVANVDPKAPVPQTVVNFVVRALSCSKQGLDVFLLQTNDTLVHQSCCGGSVPTISCGEPLLNMRSPGAQDGRNVSVLPEADS